MPPLSIIRQRQEATVTEGVSSQAGEEGLVLRQPGREGLADALSWRARPSARRRLGPGGTGQPANPRAHSVTGTAGVKVERANSSSVRAALRHFALKLNQECHSCALLGDCPPGIRGRPKMGKPWSSSLAGQTLRGCLLMWLSLEQSSQENTCQASANPC